MFQTTNQFQVSEIVPMVPMVQTSHNASPLNLMVSPRYALIRSIKGVKNASKRQVKWIVKLGWVSLGHFEPKPGLVFLG